MKRGINTIASSVIVSIILFTTQNKNKITNTAIIRAYFYNCKLLIIFYLLIFNYYYEKKIK
jgi:uncharacterized membrane protein